MCSQEKCSVTAESTSLYFPELFATSVTGIQRRVKAVECFSSTSKQTLCSFHNLVNLIRYFILLHQNTVHKNLLLQLILRLSGMGRGKVCTAPESDSQVLLSDVPRSREPSRLLDALHLAAAQSSSTLGSRPRIVISRYP